MNPGLGEEYEQNKRRMRDGGRLHGTGCGWRLRNRKGGWEGEDSLQEKGGEPILFSLPQLVFSPYFLHCWWRYKKLQVILPSLEPLENLSALQSPVKHSEELPACVICFSILQYLKQAELNQRFSVF
ncbi:hypothetical protein XENORESO_010519 [Xenotaenia resolanae]|uniref:Uncharacterized protein n=1 Tax=Xenotaenia resolanae TaxID=208358 RepID=A0ABV0X6F2_9TELE